MVNKSFGMQPATQYLSVPGGRVGYDVRGDGPLVALLPGMGELRSSYRFLVEPLVAAGHRVVTVDLRGHGDSDATFTSYGDVETASDITALMQQLGEPAVLVGNSMSAGSAVIVAAQHPELVDGLVLVGPFVRNPVSGNAFLRLAFRALMARPWVAAAWNAYLPTLYSGRKPEDFSAYRVAMIAAMKRPGYAAAFSRTTRTDHAQAENSLASVHTPTLVVMGTKDPDFKDPAAEADWIAGVLDASVAMIDDAGHYPQSQQPEATADAVIEFLASVQRRA